MPTDVNNWGIEYILLKTEQQKITYTNKVATNADGRWTYSLDFDTSTNS